MDEVKKEVRPFKVVFQASYFTNELTAGDAAENFKSVIGNRLKKAGIDVSQIIITQFLPEDFEEDEKDETVD